ncbi:MAG: DUF4367 domain-containing protein [Oscillospiraceae bacterium]
MKDTLTVNFDAILQFAALESEARMLEALEQKSVSEEYTPSAHLDDSIRGSVRRQKAKQRNKSIRSATKKIALCCCALFTIAGLAFVPVKAVQQAIVTTAMEWYNGFVTFVFKADGGESPTTLPKNLAITYWPKGYDILMDELIVEDGLSIVYGDSSGNISSIGISLASSSGMLSVDNDTTTYYQIVFDGIDAVWGSSDQGRNLLIWTKDGYVFDITTDAPLQEAIKMARGIQF